jgi:hypothetical protein
VANGGGQEDRQKLLLGTWHRRAGPLPERGPGEGL